MSVYTSRRQSIVDSIAAAIQSAVVTDAQTVFKNPFREIEEGDEQSYSELPSLMVGIVTDPSSVYNNSIEYSRSAQVVVAYMDNGNEELADKLYYMGERLERFLINAENTGVFDGLIDGLEQTGFQLKLSRAATGLGAVILNFTAPYITKHAPENLPDLIRINAEYKSKMAPADDPPLYSETITLPTT